MQDSDRNRERGNLMGQDRNSLALLCAQLWIQMPAPTESRLGGSGQAQRGDSESERTSGGHLRGLGALHGMLTTYVQHVKHTGYLHFFKMRQP